MNKRYLEIVKKLRDEGFEIGAPKTSKHVHLPIARAGKAATLILSKSPKGVRSIQNTLALARRITQ